LYPYPAAPNASLMLMQVSRRMRKLEATLREQGTENQAYYEYLMAARDMETLVDSVPGARESILNDIDEA
jgi:hypothetical protein